jgi:diaminohydroxyphosphoribosylaminopyrimidine deaminase/5-amino-6-(5-phosphoribosylamino)uracil reductase
VVVGVRDSNPSVRGAGLRLLTDAGLEVSEGACLAETRRLTQHFNTAMRRLWPFVTLKVGATLDGRIATAAGESKWITSKKQRTVARSLRRLFDGVLVGVQTAIDDDPMLLPVPRPRRPSARIILDSTLRLPLDSRLVQTARRDPLIVICVRAPEDQRRALEDRGAIVLSVPGRSGRVSLPSALRALFRRGLTSVLVEGGSEVMGSFVRAGLFDEFVLFRAPLLLGGRGSRSVVGGDNPVRLREAVRMKRASPEASATLRYGLSAPGEIDVEVYEPRDRKR